MTSPALQPGVKMGRRGSDRPADQLRWGCAAAQPHILRRAFSAPGDIFDFLHTRSKPGDPQPTQNPIVSAGLLRIYGRHLQPMD